MPAGRCPLEACSPTKPLFCLPGAAHPASMLSVVSGVLGGKCITRAGQNLPAAELMEPGFWGFCLLLKSWGCSVRTLFPPASPASLAKGPPPSRGSAGGAVAEHWPATLPESCTTPKALWFSPLSAVGNSRGKTTPPRIVAGTSAVKLFPCLTWLEAANCDL